MTGNVDTEDNKAMDHPGALAEIQQRLEVLAARVSALEALPLIRLINETEERASAIDHDGRRRFLELDRHLNYFAAGRRHLLPAGNRPDVEGSLRQWGDEPASRFLYRYQLCSQPDYHRR